MQSSMATVRLFVVIAVALICALATTAAFGDDLAETVEIQWSDPEEPDLLAKATELGNGSAIYEYVRNNFEHALYHGARSNSINTFLFRRGNQVDVASTLIAMLRSQGIPARYATGLVTLDNTDLMNWLQIQNSWRARYALVETGTPRITYLGSRTSFEHVWVQALVPLDHYRGIGPAAQIDCEAEPGKCAWVEVDPSFKLHRFRDPGELVDISDAVQFDYDAYYNAEKESYTPADGIERREKSPLETYEEQILQYLRSNPDTQGKTLEDVIYKGTVIPDECGLLPASLPYEVDRSSVKTFSSVAEHDADASLVDWSKYVRFTVSFPDIPDLQALTIPGPDVSVAELATQDLTLSFECDDFDNPNAPRKLVARLGGQLIGPELLTITGQSYTYPGGSGSFSDTPPDVGSPLDIDLTLDGSISLIDSSYPRLTLGGYFLIATGGETSNASQAHRAARRLLAATRTYPTLTDPDGVLYVDADKDGEIDPGEVPLLEHAEAQAALTAGVLAAAKALYYSHLRRDCQRMIALMRGMMPMEGFLGVVSTVHDVRAVDGTAFSIIPAGLLVDMKGVRLVSARKIDEADTRAPDAFRLAGHIGSAHEHEVWQELTGFEAISTMKGIQRTLRDGAQLMLLDEAQSQITIGDALANFGFETSLPSGFSASLLDLFGLQLWLPRRPASTPVSTLDVMRETVDAGTSDLRRRVWALSVDDDNDGDLFDGLLGTSFEYFFRFVEWQRDYLQDLLDDGYTQFTEPVQLWPGCLNSDDIQDLLNDLDDCFFDLLANPESHYPSEEGMVFFLEEARDYVDYFDENAGFAVADHLYRAFDPEGAWHISVQSLQGIRDEVVLGLSDPEYPDGVVEYVIPSQVADGELMDLAVWIRRILDAGVERQTGYIIHRAGGGYVHGNDMYDIYLGDDDWYSDDVFIEDVLTSSINNSFLTPSSDDPVATVSGNIYHDQTDLRIQGRGLDYLFTRTYNSGQSKASESGLPMGHGWTHSYNARLVAGDEGEITYVDERGGEQVFSASGSGPFSTWTVENPRGFFGELDISQSDSNLYTLSFPNGNQYTFGNANLETPGAVAQLIVVKDPHGNELTFGYAGGKLMSVTDNLGLPGRTGLTLNYYADGHLQWIRDWENREWFYTYDPQGRLATARNPLGEITSYEYAAEGNGLTAIVRPEARDGEPVRTTFDYYQNGRGFSNANSYGQGETLDYDLFRRRTRVTDARGFLTAHFHDENGELSKITQPDGAVLTFDHNPDGRRYKKTDALGYTTRYSYCTARTLDGCETDTNGNVTLEEDPRGETIEYDYQGPYDQVSRVKDKNGNERVFDYYAATDPPTGAFQDKLWKITLSSLSYYDETGVKHQDTDVLLKEYKYYSNGNLWQEIEYLDPADPGRTRTTTYEYNATGVNPAYEVVPDRITVEGTDGTTIERIFAIDDLGRVIEETLYRRTSATDPTPIPLITSYEYDYLDRVIKTTDPLGNVSETVYDGNGKVKEEKVHYKTGPSSTDTRIYVRNRYDAADRLIETKDIYDHVTTFAYDEAGNLIERTDANGNRARFDYDAMGRRIAAIDENGNRIQTTYNPGGHAIAVTDPNGETTHFEYDELGRQTAVVSPLGFRTEMTYDPNGNLESETNANVSGGTDDPNSFGVSIYREYDELGRVIKLVNQEDEETLFRYDLLGNRTEVTDAEGRTTIFHYDDLGRLVEVVDPLVEPGTDRTTTYVVDEAGNVIEETDRNAQVTHYTYDELNRLTQVDYGADSTPDEIRTYDDYGNLETLSNDSVTYTFGYDDANRLTSKHDSRLDLALGYTYDPVGNVIQKSDYQGDTTEFTYDGTGRLVSERNADYLQVSYQYDPAGRLLTRILSNGARTQYEYDADGRLTKLTNRTADDTRVEEIVYQQRDRMGRIEEAWTTVADGSPRKRLYDYDRTGRLVKVEDPDSMPAGLFFEDGLSASFKRWFWVPWGPPIDFTLGDGEVSVGYNSEFEEGGMVAQIEPLPLGPDLVQNSIFYVYMTDVQGAGVWVGLAYFGDGAGHEAFLSSEVLVTVLPGDSDVVVDGSTLTGPPAGATRFALVLMPRAPDGSATFDRFGIQSKLAGVDRLYAYDKVGNRLTEFSGQGTRRYVYDDDNRLMELRWCATAIPAIQSYEYDFEGNLETRRDRTGTPELEFGYDPAGRVAQLTAGAAVETYAYDPFGYRIEKTRDSDTQRYLLEGEHLETVYVPGPGGWLDPRLRARFLRGTVIDEVVNAYLYDTGGNPTNYTYHHDALQSVVALSGHAGSAEQTLEYGPFGEELGGTGSSPNFLRYTGRERDSTTGLYYYRARYYDPSIGRFLSEDPLGFGAGMNFYTYAQNDPINANDPMGKDTYHFGFSATAGAGEPFSSWRFGQGGAVAGMAAWDTQQNYGVAANAISGPHYGFDLDVNFVFGTTTEPTMAAYEGYQRQLGGSLDIPLGRLGGINLGYELLINEQGERIGWEASVGYNLPGDAAIPVEVHDYSGGGSVTPLGNWELGLHKFRDESGNVWDTRPAPLPPSSLRGLEDHPEYPSNTNSNPANYVPFIK